MLNLNILIKGAEPAVDFPAEPAVGPVEHELGECLSAAFCRPQLSEFMHQNNIANFEF